DILERAVAASERRAECVDDDGRRHEGLLRSRDFGRFRELDRTVKSAAEPVLGQTPGTKGMFLLHSSAMHRGLVLRHGESTWNAEGRWKGWADAPLTGEGGAQAAARARELARDGVNPRAIFTSDLARARRTAEIIGAHLERPVIPDTDLRERH